MPVYLSHYPAGASFKQWVHYCQIYNSGEFKKRDFGVEKNLEVYGSEKPPLYDLSLVTAPVALHYGANDNIVSRNDIENIKQQLSNTIGVYEVELPLFNHLDFVYGIDAKTLVYDKILSIMNDFE